MINAFNHNFFTEPSVAPDHLLFGFRPQHFNFYHDLFLSSNHALVISPPHFPRPLFPTHRVPGPGDQRGDAGQDGCGPTDPAASFVRSKGSAGYRLPLLAPVVGICAPPLPLLMAGVGMGYH